MTTRAGTRSMSFAAHAGGASANGYPTGTTDAAHHPERAFGADVFTGRVMQQRLPKDVYRQLQKTIEHAEPLDPAVAD